MEPDGTVATVRRSSGLIRMLATLLGVAGGEANGPLLDRSGDEVDSAS